MDRTAFICSFRKNQLLEAYREQIHKGARLLDIGCGNGTMGHAVAQSFNAYLEGADVVNMLTAPIPFHPLEGFPWKWEDRSFDAVMLNDSLHHMKPEIQRATLREALRVGKKVLIFETYPTALAKIIDVIMGRIVYGDKEAVPLTHKTPQDWEKILGELKAHCEWRELPRPIFIYPLRHFRITASV